LIQCSKKSLQLIALFGKKRRVTGPILVVMIHRFQFAELVHHRPQVKPALGPRRRRIMNRFHRGEGTVVVGWIEIVFERFGVQGFDIAEAAILALASVPIAVVVAVFGGQPAARELINDHDL
jgi:hypothetical protein